MYTLCKWTLPVLLALVLTGCQTAGNLLTEPLHIRCVGKGETIIQAGPYAGLIKSDCGEGFEYSLERGRPAEVAK